jgi:hypothetical protein
MIASRPFQDAVRGVGRNALDLPVAALAGLAVAVVAFAMPQEILEELVGATGLPSVLAAAEAPLGFTARAILGIGGGLTVFALVFVLLRLLDRSGFEPKRRPRPKLEPEPEPEAMPKVRRRDFHPDAPARRPISATRDLGEPAPPQLPEPELVPELQPEPEPEPEVVTEPQPVAEPEPEPIATVPVWVDQPEAVEPAPAQTTSLDHLMARLEQGLAKRRTRPVVGQMPQHDPGPPQAFPEAGDDRLQSAIESLQRLAARQA